MSAEGLALARLVRWGVKGNYRDEVAESAVSCPSAIVDGMCALSVHMSDAPKNWADPFPVNTAQDIAFWTGVALRDHGMECPLR